MACDELNNEIYQLGIILYPSDRLNEKFLIKIRECILKLADEHPVKVWLKSVAKVSAPTPDEQIRIAFLTEILNSKFNLITDLKTKNQIIEVLIDVPESNIGEKLLKSYLFLMIGNVTRSDNILKEIINKPPFENWKDNTSSPSIYYKALVDNFESVVTKIAKHPSDRKVWELFSRYLREFTNDGKLLEILEENAGDHLDGKLSLQYIERISPNFVSYLRLKRLDEPKLVSRLRTMEISQKDQAYWVWYFLPINSYISDAIIGELASVEEKDPLWFIYLMENEKLSDFYSTKTGKAFIPGKRHILRSFLSNESLYMLSLWKLIGMGDIDKKLVLDTSKFLNHE